jgi:acetyl-CoA synthetase
VKQTLLSLRIAPLLSGYRGKPGADLDAVLEAIMAVQSYVLANVAHVHEVEVNPLICTPSQTVVADALIRRTP